MWQWFGVSAKAALNMRWTQFINHANYKIIDSNVMDWANVTKIHTPSSAKHYFLPWRICAVQRPRMTSFRKSLLASHSAMEICYSSFVDTKCKCLTLGAIAVVSYNVFRALCNTSLLFLFFDAGLTSRFASTLELSRLFVAPIFNLFDASWIRRLP